MDILQHRWRQLQYDYKEGAWDVLDAGYSESTRAYHNWAHIADLLDKLGEFKDVAIRPDLIAHAIFWHDVVYQTQNPDGSPRSDTLNVKESAEAFLKMTKLSGRDRDAVFDLIMATANHRDPKAGVEHYPGFENDLRLFLDLDLSRLGASWEEAAGDTQKIRTEYAWVPEIPFCERRAHVLEGFDKVEPLFFHPQTRARWEEAAHRNLKRSVTELRARAGELHRADRITELEQNIAAVLAREPLQMLDLLPLVEPMMPDLLKDEAAWKSLYIDYEKPHLMRLWRPVGEARVYLHYFVAANEITQSPGSNLYHPHEWASVMRILDGRYMQGIGFARAPGVGDNKRPAQTLFTTLAPGSAYAMNHPNVWHEVRPEAGKTASTLMITAKKPEFAPNRIVPPVAQRELTREEHHGMFEYFRGYYPAP